MARVHGEFPALPDDVWVIATFENNHAFMIDNDPALIYSEMNFRIEHIFKKPDNLSLSVGDLIDAGIAGGRLKTSERGSVSPTWLRPADHYYRKGHKYLMQLAYEAQGGFFYAYTRWDISSGKVQPDGPVEIERANRGESAIAGMSVTDLIRYLPSLLSNASNR
jgi:hypothetical protein